MLLRIAVSLSLICLVKVNAFSTAPSVRLKTIRRNRGFQNVQEATSIAFEDNGDTQQQEDEYDGFWSQERYLKFHQTVGKRKTIRRLIEIVSVLSGKIFRPLVCSFVKEPHLSKNWDEFWATKPRQRGLSNAERFVQGLPMLGPTAVKLGQVLATRPDMMAVPFAEALANIQDRVAPFDNRTALRIIRRELKIGIEKNAQRLEDGSLNEKCYLKNEQDLQRFIESLSEEPVASGSVAQVYKGYLEGYGDVAIKVQRPGIRKTAEKDATLLHTVASFLQNLKWPEWTPIESSRGEPVFGSTQIVTPIDEFTTRVLEEMDFVREVKNIQLFADMYCHKRGSSRDVQVVVPDVITALCTRRLIVMEWIEGQKLTDVCLDCDDSDREIQENLDLVRRAVEMTLSQLLSDGLLHSDPHESNLVKVKSDDGNQKHQIGYLDFGLVSKVPQRFQDGIVCATCQIVFARNISAVTDFCVDLGLIPEDKLKDDEDRKRFVSALEQVMDDVLIWPKDQKGRSTAVPKIRFERALPAMSKLITNFEFTVPPYFLNNARLMATLEGIGLKLDPDFNIVRVIYPYSLNHLMRNPDISRKSEETFLSICRSPETKLFDHGRFMKLLNDWSLLTGLKKRKIYWDLISSVGTRRVMGRIFRESFVRRVRHIKRWYQKRVISHFERFSLIHVYDPRVEYPHVGQ